MKLFKISQEVNMGYDTYSDAIVCADNEEEAQKISPCAWNDDRYCTKDKHRDTVSRFKKDLCYSCDSWCAIEDVKVEYIGEAKPDLKKGVICASYHAG